MCRDLYCWCYRNEIISMLDWQAVPRALNWTRLKCDCRRYVFGCVCVCICDKGKPKYRWQINETDNNNFEMDQNSQAKRKANMLTFKSTSNAFRQFAHMFLRSSRCHFLRLFLFQSTVFVLFIVLVWIEFDRPIFRCAFATLLFLLLLLFVVFVFLHLC